eukprot:g44871.t1
MADFGMLEEGLVSPGRPRATVTKPALSLLGILLMSAAGWASASKGLFTYSSNKGGSSFIPKKGLDGVLFKPGPPSAAQLTSPAGLSTKGPSALFVYCDSCVGTLEGSETSLPAELVAGATFEEGWVYGAKKVSYGKLPRGRTRGSLAMSTGSTSDVIKGRVMRWPSTSFVDKLRACDHVCQADKCYGYDANRPQQGMLRRSVVSVVVKDGSTVQAYMYHQANKEDEAAQQAAAVNHKPAVQLSLAVADRIANGALDAARALKTKPVAVVVVDSNGDPIVSKRQDGCPAPTFPEFALAKAYTCAQLGMGSTRALRDKYNSPDKASQLNTMVAITEGKLAAFPGGVLILAPDGVTVMGAVGVSGASSDEDEACAVTGIKATGYKTDPAIIEANPLLSKG